MNDRRTYLLIGLSLLLHLGILWLLPAPTFETDRQDEERSLRVSLLDRDRPRRDDGDRTPRQEEVRPEESASEDRSPEPDPEEEQPPEEESGPSVEKPPERPEPREVVPPEEPAQDVPSAKTPDRPEVERPDEPEPPEEEEPTYDLLASGPGGGAGPAAGSSGRGSGRNSGTTSTALAGEDVEKFEVVKTFDAENRRGETVSIRVPEHETDTRGVIKAPAYTVSRASPDPSALGDTDDPTEGYRQPTLPSGGREILRQPLPTVPSWLEETGEEVRVIVRYDIDRDGEVSAVEVVTSSGYPDLDARVVQKTGQWQFEPGPESERRLAVFRFVLD